ncbi:MAG: toll/interleukin-1 receptor domain-containing protein [Isosphaeraceae bacterium]|nr:toll/interleukin-1 receptor domain-containing protein [Isosphaeraceae bacterium]
MNEHNNSVFLSYSLQDTNLVNLIEAVLKYSGVGVWRCESDLAPGLEFRREIEGVIAMSDTLVVVVSRYSAASDWVRHEVALFSSKTPPGRVIPVCLDPTPANSVFVGLDKFQIIDFSQCMLTGFVNLLNAFGKDFYYREKRKDRDARKKRDRRDPRNSARRLRRRFWLAFEKATGYGKFDNVTLGPRIRGKLTDILYSKVYDFILHDERGNDYDPGAALREAVELVWVRAQGLGAEESATSAIGLVESVADAISTKYRVASVDRRLGPDRRNQNSIEKSDMTDNQESPISTIDRGVKNAPPKRPSP